MVRNVIYHAIGWNVINHDIGWNVMNHAPTVCKRHLQRNVMNHAPTSNNFENENTQSNLSHGNGRGAVGELQL